MHARVAEVALPPGRGPAAGPGGLPRRPRARRRRQGRPGDAAGPAGQRLRPARCRREDRLRRGLHDRRLDDRPRHGPRRPAGPVRQPHVLASSTRCCSGCGTGVERTQPAHEENSKQNSRTNISRHYDLSNELFEQFLDETMTYSSGWFEPGDDLADAQRRKMDGILDLARVRAGMHVLEIGSGWGGLAIRAARERGARVTTLTLSTEQQALARQRADDAGVGHLVDVRLQDYRDATGQYDAIVSVEMIEAVGEALLADLLRAPSTPCSHRAAGSGCRRSRWRTTGCWPPGAATAGSTSTCSRAGSSRRCGRSRTTWPRTPTCRSWSAATWARTTRTPWRSGGSSSSATGTGSRAPSTTRSGGCGSSTSPTARPGSASATSGVSQLGLARNPFAGA